MTISAFISGCEGLFLNEDEKRFLKDANPWGFILFGRNVDTPEQVEALVASFRECVGRSEAPVLIDQEGGRVQRLRPPHWPFYPPGAVFGTLESEFPGEGKRAAFLGGRLLAYDLLSLGINVDCLPVLDVPVPNTTKAIGDRAYSPDPVTVSQLGGAAADGALAGGVLPVIKHLPGHGRALVDSHLDLPRVSASENDLALHDFAAFKPLKNYPMGMTAHVVYESIDSTQPATLSRKVIQTIIREQIGFTGLLMSDDVSMGALQSPMGERTAAAISAGCDIVLHCNGVMEEMLAVAANVPSLAGEAEKRAKHALSCCVAPGEFDSIAARIEFDAFMTKAGWGA
ncbi:MAG: beta-N-acetylhexosaminidase [Hyphomicrobiales bacterium]